jgi:hypothetical protein
VHGTVRVSANGRKMIGIESCGHKTKGDRLMGLAHIQTE